VFGVNFKLTNVQAAIGLAQLEKLPRRLEHARRLRAWYEEELASLADAVQIPALQPEEAIAWIDILAAERDALVEHLESNAIDPRPFWRPLHTQGPYPTDGAAFPNASWVAARGLWLPSALQLSRDDVARVGDVIRRFVLGGSLAASPT
jgi:perosamine synthetase